jgi:hypothetical protein
MKNIALFASLAILAACSEPAPPPAPPKPKAEAPQPAPAPVAVAPAPEPVKAPEAPKPDPNKELAAKVKEALEAPDAKLPTGAIDVTAADGKITLWGALPSEREVRRAAQLAGKVDGVRGVENQLKVVKGS